MASLESDERNIIEAEEINWRLIVYPVLILAIVVLGGTALWFYHANQQEKAEEAAATALSGAKTPEDIVKVADQYSGTIQARVGLMRAADLSFTAKDYAAAMKEYQDVIDSKEAPPELRESAQLGLASAQEASGKSDDAIQTYLDVAHKGHHSPFAPVAYHQVAAIYASRQDKAKETQILQQEVQLGGDSAFVKEAENQLKELAAPASTTNATPAP